MVVQRQRFTRIEKNFHKCSPLYGVVIVLFLWYLLHVLLRSHIIPGPYETVMRFVGLMGGVLPMHILMSLYRIVLAMVIALGAGVPLGLWLGLDRNADTFISPVAYILYPIPKVAFLPVLMILFGLGNEPKIILIVVIIIFPILLAARDGVREIPRELFISIKSLGLNRRLTCYHLVLPAVLPKILSALRISVGISISVLFFAENFATTYGLGYFIMNSWAMVAYEEMFAGILTLSIMGILIFKLIDALEKKICPWLFIRDMEN